MSARTLKHLQRLCAPKRQLRRGLLPTEDTPPTMPRRIGAFLCNGFVQIGAGIEGVFDHLREGMQAFEAVRTFGIAEFGLAQRSAQHLNGPIVNFGWDRKGPAVLAAMREGKPRGIAETTGGAVDDLTDERQRLERARAHPRHEQRIGKGVQLLIMRHGQHGAQALQINIAARDVMPARHDQVPRSFFDMSGIFPEQPDNALLRSDGVPMHQIEHRALRVADDRRVRFFREGAQGA